MIVPSVVADAPPAWVAAADVAPPPLSEGTGAVVTQWSAWRSANGAEIFALGCVATPIPGWVEEMRAAVTVRANAITFAVAERLVGAPVFPMTEGDPSEPYLRLVSPSAPPNAPAVGQARVFVGFPRDKDAERRVFTCLATCTRRSDASTTHEPERSSEKDSPIGCTRSVIHARLGNDGPPPAAGAFLSAATWGVQHPRQVGIGGALAAALAGVLAVATRRKPRTRV